METDLVFSFSIDVGVGVEPAARLWVDINADKQLQDNEEVTLKKEKDFVWSGKVKTAQALKNVTFYLKYLAPIGATWKLKVTDGADDDAKVLYKQKGKCGQQPSFVAGWFDDDA